MVLIYIMEQEANVPTAPNLTRIVTAVTTMRACKQDSAVNVGQG
jgi:hypothetical protein